MKNDKLTADEILQIEWLERQIAQLQKLRKKIVKRAWTRTRNWDKSKRS